LAVAKGVYLVTGAAGFLGGAACSLLESRGDPYLGVDRAVSGAAASNIIQCDVTDIHALHALATRNSILGIIHCGAFSGPMVARDNPHAIVQVNVVGAANVLELARVHGIERFVFCSSAGVYGNTPGAPVSEDAPLHPTNLYGASKVAGEQLVATYSRQYGIDGVSLRLAWVYGPRRSTDCVIRTMLEDALARRTTRMPFGQDFSRQFIHVRDAAAALVAALDRRRLKRQAYNISGGTRVTLGEVADVVRRILPHADIELGEGPDPVDDIQHEFALSAAEADLGFTPSVTLEEGIALYARWLASESGGAPKLL
jgi:nucleoside-diphosphate-sugar epimerase